VLLHLQNPTEDRPQQFCGGVASVVENHDHLTSRLARSNPRDLKQHARIRRSSSRFDDLSQRRNGLNTDRSSVRWMELLPPSEAQQALSSFEPLWATPPGTAVDALSQLPETSALPHFRSPRDSSTHARRPAPGPCTLKQLNPWVWEWPRCVFLMLRRSSSLKSRCALPR
jgi:hypothetical protein